MHPWHACYTLVFEAQCTLGMRVTPLTAHILNTLAHTSDWASVSSVWAWSMVDTLDKRVE